MLKLISRLDSWTSFAYTTTSARWVNPSFIRGDPKVLRFHSFAMDSRSLVIGVLILMRQARKKDFRLIERSPSVRCGCQGRFLAVVVTFNRPLRKIVLWRRVSSRFAYCSGLSAFTLSALSTMRLSLFLALSISLCCMLYVGCVGGFNFWIATIDGTHRCVKQMPSDFTSSCCKATVFGQHINLAAWSFCIGTTKSFNVNLVHNLFDHALMSLNFGITESNMPVRCLCERALIVPDLENVPSCCLLVHVLHIIVILLNRETDLWGSRFP